MKKSLLWIAVALILQSCSTEKQQDYVSDWKPGVTSHSLVFPESMSTQLLWTQQVFVLGSAEKNVQCVSTENVIVLAGSQNINDPLKVFALDGNTGMLLWKFDAVGILAYSDAGVFIGSNTTVYLVEPKTGAVKWQKQLSGLRHITNMIYYENLLFINGTGFYPFYVLNNAGTIISKYSEVAAFHSEYSAVPFFPTLPFGAIVDNDLQIIQTGDGLYSAQVHDKQSNARLWEINNDSISNFVVFRGSILWIAPDGVVKFADEHNGSIVESIMTEPSIEFFNSRTNVQDTGYYLCGDNQSNHLYVILGDSRQIFALAFKH